jgi:hypothetical protein
MHRKIGLSFAMLLGLATVAQASATLVVGTHLLFPNTNGGPLNTFTISISGNDTNIAGAVINAQVADGGPLVGGAVVAPGFTGNMTTPGALFATNNTGIADLNGGAFGNQLVLLQTTTNAGTVSDVGGVTLVTLTFDTTGFSYGVWPLIFSGTLNGDTGIGSTAGIIPLQITNGNIWLEPEPSSLVLALLAAASLAAIQWRRRFAG